MPSTSIPKIVSLAPLPKGALEMFLSPYLGATRVELESIVDKKPDEIPGLISTADILLGDFTFQFHITADTIKNASHMRLIQQPSVGYQHIDISACRKKGIPVANTAGANSGSVAEHAIMLALVLLRQTLYFNEKTSRGEWTQMEAFDRGVFELAGKRWGIVGMGRIGMELVKRLKAFGVEIVYYDLRRLDKNTEEELGLEYLPFEKLLARSDIASLHIPLVETTRNIMSENTIRKMKTGSFIINVARGELIDERALAEALNAGKIAGAGLDVFTNEPVNPNCPLLKCKNVVLTPHLAGTTAEARTRIIETAAKNIVGVLKGEKPFNVVNGL